MSQGEKVEKPKEKKKVPGWSIEGMKERPDIAVEEHTEEMKRWRSPNQSGMDLCWKSLADRMEEEVLENTKSKRARKGPSKAEVTLWNGEEYAETRDIKLESGEKIAGR